MKKLSFYISLMLLISCGGSDENTNESVETKTPEIEVIEESVIYVPTDGIDVEALNQTVDLDMDISELNLSDIRILRNSFAAKQGYCFMKADLRAIFNTTTWYNEKMDERYWSEEQGDAIAPIQYSKDEQAFIDKLTARENELKEANFSKSNDRTHANVNNIVNLFQLEEADPALMQMLANNGFGIVPNDNIQLFHVYEQNDYQQFPNFITTDMYMQLFHMYFGYVLRTVEEEQFIPILTEVSQTMMNTMNSIAKTSSDKSIQDLAKYNATYFAISYSILSEKTITVEPAYKEMYQEELASIKSAEDGLSNFLDYKLVAFPYSLFKPRGHYTRTAELKRYFKAMMWLQTAPFCLDNDLHFKRAILSASVITEGANFNPKVLSQYKRLMEPVSFIIGQPDNVSFLNLSKQMKKGNYSVNDLLTDNGSLNKFRKEIKKIADAQNKIKPKEAMSCVDKINFMPQRYLADNEILQELVDVESEKSKRAYPKGLDVMAAFGSESAENILLNELKEGDKWSEYPKKLSTLKSKMQGLDWNATIYNKWIESLLELQKPNSKYPYFMQNKQWDKKDLNASLASWAELKHDAILYAEQPMGAECGGGGPPDPYTVGYVEPNIAYWNSVLELIDLTEKILKANDLFSSKIERVSTKLKENAKFLLTVSNKELAGEKLLEQEYNQIEVMGSTFEWLTLDLVKQNDEYLESWDNVNGPDKSVAVVADIYTANASNNQDKGILHVATGNVNDIYVVVEIEGYLYLTKGAVFAYHEFHIPMGNRLTDEEWQEMLDKNEAPEIPDWIKEIIVPIAAPKANEKIFYSSGC